MDLVYASGRATAREVREGLADPPSYATVRLLGGINSQWYDMAPAGGDPVPGYLGEGLDGGVDPADGTVFTTANLDQYATMSVTLSTDASHTIEVPSQWAFSRSLLVLNLGTGGGSRTLTLTGPNVVADITIAKEKALEIYWSPTLLKWIELDYA